MLRSLGISMAILDPILILLLLAILYGFWRHVAGLSMSDLFERSAREHRRVHDVIAGHPDGGDWQDYRRWMKGTR